VEFAKEKISELGLTDVVQVAFVKPIGEDVEWLCR
jgi:hypothetical protein